MNNRRNKQSILQSEYNKPKKILKKIKRKSVVQSNDYQLKNEIKTKLGEYYKYDKKKYLADNLSKIRKLKSDIQELEKINGEQKLKMQVIYKENLQIETNIENIKNEVENAIMRNRYLYDSLFLLEEEVKKREKEIVKPKTYHDIPFEIIKFEKQIEKIIKEVEQLLNEDKVDIFNEVERARKEKLTTELFFSPDLDINALNERIIFIEKKIGDSLLQQRDIYKKIFYIEHKQRNNNDEILAIENVIEENNSKIKIMSTDVKNFEKANVILTKNK